MGSPMKDFANLLQLTQRELQVFFGKKKNVNVPKLLLWEIANYMQTLSPNGNDKVDLQAMVLGSSLLANSNFKYLKGLVRIITGNRSSEYERNVLDDAGGIAIPITSENMRRALQALCEQVSRFGDNGYLHFHHISHKKGGSGSDLGPCIASLFHQHKHQKAGKQFMNDHKAGIEELDTILKSAFRSMHNLPEQPTVSGIRLAATILCSKQATRTQPQDAHQDYTSLPDSAAASIAFLSLDQDRKKSLLGLQLWTKEMKVKERGTLIAIPRDVLVIFPGKAPHAGGLTITDEFRSGRSNYRMHFYIHHGIGNEQETKKKPVFYT
jgi:hypothetical protein